MRYIRVAARHGEIQADPEEHPKLDPLVKNGTPTLKLNLPNLAATETTLRYNSRASVGSSVRLQIILIALRGTYPKVWRCQSDITLYSPIG